jgi:hypothetical protein
MKIGPDRKNPQRGSPESVSRHAQRHWFAFMWLLAPIFMTDGTPFLRSIPSAPAVRGTVTEVRSLYPSEWGVPHPTGLAYISGYNHLALLANTDASGSTLNRASIVTITPYEDLVDGVNLPVAADNATNLAYDDATDHLLFLNAAASQVLRVPVGSDGVPNPGGLAPIDVSHLRLGQPEGMDVDTSARRLFILDSSAAAVVIADMDNEFTFVSRLDLSHLAATDLRGLAFHPSRRTLFVTSPSQALMFEVAVSGGHLGTYDLAPLAPIDVRSLTFGPSADLTDAPDTVHLFLADYGAPATIPLFGRIVEAAFQQRPRCSTPRLQQVLPVKDPFIAISQGEAYHCCPTVQALRKLY